MAVHPNDDWIQIHSIRQTVSFPASDLFIGTIPPLDRVLGDFASPGGGLTYVVPGYATASSVGNGFAYSFCYGSCAVS